MSFIPADLPIVDPPRKKDLESLLDLNFRLERNSITNNYVEAKFLGKNLKSKHLNALLRIKDQLIKLDLSNSNLNDNLVSKLNSLKNLKYLKINNTKITDKGLSSISSSLESLNLNENKVSFDGLQELLSERTLQTVYLWNTNISDENQKKLLSLSTAELNFGVNDFSKGVPLSAPKSISEQTMFSDSLLIEFFKR